MTTKATNLFATKVEHVLAIKKVLVNYDARRLELKRELDDKQKRFVEKNRRL